MSDNYKGKSDHDLLIISIEKLDNLREWVESLSGKVDKQNSRVRKLENWRSYIMGAIIIMGFIIGILIKGKL